MTTAVEAPFKPYSINLLAIQLDDSSCCTIDSKVYFREVIQDFSMLLQYIIHLLYCFLCFFNVLQHRDEWSCGWFCTTEVFN